MSIQHAYTQTVADGTATSVVRPSDWNSNHNMVLNLAGNTLGTSQVSGQDIVWAGGSNVTLSANGSTVSVIGVPAQTTQTQPAGNIAGSGYTFTTQAGTSIGATHNSAGLSIAQPLFLTTAAQSNHSHNFATTTTNGSQIVVGTTNSAGATIGVPPFITTFTQPGATVFSNSNNVSFGLNGSTVTATATFAQSTQTQPAGNIAGVGTTYAGTNVNATLGLNSNGLALSLSAAGGGVTNQTGPNIAAGGSTITDGTVLFSNANGVSFGLNGSTMTASINTQPDAWYILGNTAGANSSYLWTNDGLYLAGGNNITLSQNGSTLTIVGAAGGGGGGVTIKDWFPMQMAASSTSSFGQNTVHFAHLLPPENVSFTCVEMLWSYSHSSSAIATWGKTTTLHYGVYSEDAGGTNMALMSSSSMLIQMTASSNVSFALSISQGTQQFATSTAASAWSAFNQAGWKAVSLPFAGSLPPASAGPYYFAYRASTASGGANVAQTHNIMMNNEVSNASIGGWSPSTVLATNKSLVQEPYGFILSVTSNALPATVAYSDMSINSNTQPYLYFEA